MYVQWPGCFSSLRIIKWRNLVNWNDMEYQDFAMANKNNDSIKLIHAINYSRPSELNCVCVCVWVFSVKSAQWLGHFHNKNKCENYSSNLLANDNPRPKTNQQRIFVPLITLSKPNKLPIYFVWIFVKWRLPTI